MHPRATTTFHPMKRTLLARTMIALLAASAFTITPSALAHTDIIFSVNLAPPPLPVYYQSPIPESGYMWVPGYWAYDRYYGYFWVPGTWVRAPYSGALWTPGYWGWNQGNYVFNDGYWGDRVGYYGGINYGFGYTGDGYYGGYWNNGGFYYNTAYNQLGSGVQITNVYNKTVINNYGTINNYSYNGPGGVTRQATAQELAVARERRVAPLSEQVRQVTLASQNQALRASVNHGKPPITATPRAGDFAHSSASKADMAGTNGAAHANAHADFGQNTAAAARMNGAEHRAAHEGTMKSANYAPHSGSENHSNQMAPHGGRVPSEAAHQSSGHRDAGMQSAHEPRMNSEPGASHMGTQQRHQSTNTMDSGRSMSSDSRGHSVQAPRQNMRTEGPSQMPATRSENSRQDSGMREAAPRQAPPQRAEPRQPPAQRSEPRQAPAQRNEPQQDKGKGKDKQDQQDQGHGG